MIKAIKEFFWYLWTPNEEICKVKGHKLETLKFKIRRRPNAHQVMWGYVVVDYSVEISVCSRCGYREKPKNEEYLDGYHSCTMGVSRWDEMKSRGYVTLGRL